MTSTDELHAEINENAWMVSRTGKPIATVDLRREEAEAVCKWAEEQADKLGIHMKIVAPYGEADDVVEMCFYREQIILDTFLYLSNPPDYIPLDIRECLEGLLFGYRSDAIQQHVDRLKSKFPFLDEYVAHRLKQGQTAMIIDGHNYCFPQMDLPQGYDTLAEKMRILQSEYGGHYQPPWRVRDRKQFDNSVLVDLETGELRDIRWTPP